MATMRTTAAMAALVSATGGAAAQGWPNRAVTMVVPFAAGGPADTVGRILALHRSDFLNQQVIVENIGGAGGMTGTSRVAKAAPDGYQLVPDVLPPQPLSATLSAEHSTRQLIRRLRRKRFFANRTGLRPH